MKMRGNSSRNVKKHVPQRTCIACREVKNKQELVRLVRVADGSVEIDINGKKAGRGAYLCLTEECWAKGFKEGRLGYALKANISPENRDRLIAWFNEREPAG
jgi:predicted RNA-binding protein YlxR (DUF448 family)